MNQHYTSLTVEASAWCNRCSAMTQHRVADKRLQFCLVCFEKSAAESVAKKNEPKEELPKQGDLFG